MAMALTVEEIEKQIHSLAASDRDRLFRDLVAELDGGEDEDVESLWLEEAQRRFRELQSGAVEGVPLDDVLDRVRSRLTHGD